MSYWNLPILRFGNPHESLAPRRLIHFFTGERLGEVSQANPGLLIQDVRSAQRTRNVLREIPCRQLVRMIEKATDLYLRGGEGALRLPPAVGHSLQCT